MLKTHLMTGVAAVALLLASPLVPQVVQPLSATAALAQRASVSVNVFFNSSMRDHGSWVRLGGRYVFVPDVDKDWRPYRHGRWVHTARYGWYFRSSEPFAWAVYHYGRWGFDRRIGWYWVPGTRWAPAWVSWRRSNDAIGWAPLPPEGNGYSFNVSVSIEPPRGYWNFVPADRFLDDDLDVVVINHRDDRDYYDRTQPAGPVIVQNNIVINNVIDIDFVQNVTNKQVTEVEVQTAADPAQAQSAGADAVVAVEGELAPPTPEEAPPEAVEPDKVKAPTAEQADTVEETAPPPPADGAAPPPADGAAPPPADGAAPPPPADGAAPPPADGAKPADQAPPAVEPAKPADAAPAAPDDKQPAAEEKKPEDQAAPPKDEAAPPAPPAAEPAKPAEPAPAPEKKPEDQAAPPADAAPAPAPEQRPAEAAPPKEEAAPAPEPKPEEQAAPPKDEAAPPVDEAKPKDDGKKKDEECAAADRDANGNCP